MSMMKLLASGKLSHRALVTWSVIDDNTDEDGKCRLSNNEIAALMHRTGRTVQFCLKELVRLKALAVQTTTTPKGKEIRHLIPLDPKT